MCERGEAAWPQFRVDRDALVAYVDARPAVTDPTALDDDAITELYLCCACNLGVAAAQAAFDERYLGNLAAALAHMKLDADTVDEVTQRVRRKLLVASDGGSAKIDEYAGRGKLRGLIKVVAVRAALDLLRKRKREAPVAADELAALPTPERDPELAYIKESYRAEFSAAFERAVRQLTSRERNLLRMHQLRGVTLEQLAEMYDVHRATVVRWLARARAAVLDQTQKHLRTQLGVSREELDSMMELLHSRFDISVERIMQTIDGS